MAAYAETDKENLKSASQGTPAGCIRTNRGLERDTLEC